jgi:hypothetical protein
MLTTFNVTLTDPEKASLRNAMIQSSREVLAADPSLANNPDRLSAAIVDNITNNPTRNPDYQASNALIQRAAGSGGAGMTAMAIGAVKANLATAITENKPALTAAMPAPAVTPPVASAAPSAPAVTPPVVSAAPSAPAVTPPVASAGGPASPSAAPRTTTSPTKAEVTTAQAGFLEAVRSGNAHAAGEALDVIARAQKDQIQTERTNRRNAGINPTPEATQRLARFQETANINTQAARDLKGAGGQKELERALNTPLNNGQGTVGDMLNSPNPRTRDMAMSYICNSCGNRTDLAHRDLATLNTAARIEAAGITGVAGVNGNFGGGVDVNTNGAPQAQGAPGQAAPRVR